VQVSPLLVVELLSRIVDVLRKYFGVKLTETAIQENFATVYQVRGVAWCWCSVQGAVCSVQCVVLCLRIRCACPCTCSFWKKCSTTDFR